MPRPYSLAITSSLLMIAAACAEMDIRADDRHTVPEQAKDCVADLDFIASFLLENDAGIQGMGWKSYPAAVEKVLERERASAADAQSVPDCVATITNFLRAVRKGHLEVVSTQAMEAFRAGSSKSPKVVFRRLSSEILYVDVPSFGTGVGEQLVKAIEAEGDALMNVRGLIIDLRQNGGGRDPEAQPLYGLLGPATYASPYPDFLVTPTNLAAWEAFAAQNPLGLEKIQPFIARMKAAGTPWVSMSDVAIWESRYELADVKANPEQVVLLIGPECGSSCEQLVLAARQNERVTLMGRRTFGAVDASNMFLAQTPSGQITLYYATSFVRRPEGQVIDDIGIPPDIELPMPADEAAFVAEVAIAQKAIEDGFKLSAREAQQEMPADQPRAAREPGR